MFTNFMHKIIGKTPLTPPGKLPKAHERIETQPVIKQDEPHACRSYTRLKVIFRDVGRMNAIIEALGRDFLTAMPSGAYKSRLGHMAFLSRRLHEDLASDEVRKLLDKAQEHQYTNGGMWDDWDSANLREMASLYRMYCSVSPELMEKKAHLNYEGRRRHSKIKKTGSWDDAKDLLSEQIDLHRAIADARCETFDESSHYQMLMQEYMPGMTVFEVENLFSDHENRLKTLLPQILKKQKKDPAPLPLEGKYPQDAQMWLNRSLLKVIGFDFTRGGLYETGHNPVEGGTPEDTRLVISNVDEDNFMDSMKSVLHEGGHGLYIQGLPRKDWRYQPVAMDLGAGVHESQALLIEMIIGRTNQFFEFLSPRLEGVFHGINAPALSPENLRALKTRVAKTTQRRSADEVTYFYHILLRFRLERDLIDGSLKIEDLPEAWVEGLHELLGVYPESHLDGCLQDVHWFVGKFGYFPSYIIGHMLAAQFYDALDSAIPDMRTQIAEGHFEDIKRWLHYNVYEKGRLLPMRDLVKQATGHKLRADALEKHLRSRYL